MIQSGNLDNGSAPRVRGTQERAKALGASNRFSPARAGNSSKRLLQVVRLPVQPRACGELKIERASGIWTSGSAPRVRGTHRNAQCI